MEAKKKRVLGVVVVLAVVLLLIAARLALPIFLTERLNDTLGSLEGYQGSVEDVDVWLLRGAVAIKGFEIEISGDEGDIPLFKADTIDSSIHWSALLDGEIVGELVLRTPVFNIVPSQGDSGSAGASGAKDEVEEKTSWVEQVKGVVMPITLNRFEVKDGTIAFKDPSTTPPVDIYLRELQATITNISNTQEASETLPTEIRARGVSIGGGDLDIQGRAFIIQEIPDLNLDIKFKGMSLPAVNSFTSAYAYFDFESGTLDVLSEVIIDDGLVSGYVKPFVNDAEVLELGGEERDPLWQRVWEGVVGLGERILSNPKSEAVATRIELKGDLNNIETKPLSAVLTLLKNAFIEALSRQLDGDVELEPAQ